MTDPSRVLKATERWIRQFVVGKNLCPFAAAPLQAKRIQYRPCEQTDADAVFRELLEEIEAFLSLPPEKAETGLFVCCNWLPDFEEYLDVFYSAEEVLEQAGLSGIIQLASFHPGYLFDQADASDPANYTNRSPYPMFHLIREAGLSAALESYPDPESIPKRNAEKLRKLGLAELEQQLALLQLDKD